MRVLATEEQVKAFFGSEIPPEKASLVPAWLSQASALFAKEARRSWEVGERVTRCLAKDGEAWLREEPAEVIRVTSPTGAELVVKQSGRCLESEDSRFSGPIWVHARYDPLIPDLVANTVAGAVAKMINLDDDSRRGVIRSTTTEGPFSNTEEFAPWTAGGSLVLSPAELETARSFRPKRHLPAWEVTP